MLRNIFWGQQFFSRGQQKTFREQVLKNVVFRGQYFFPGTDTGKKYSGTKNRKTRGQLICPDRVRGHTFESGDSLGDRVLSPKVRGQLRGQKLCSQMVGNKIGHFTPTQKR